MFMVGIVICTRLLKALIKLEMQMGRQTLQLLLDKSNLKLDFHDPLLLLLGQWLVKKVNFQVEKKNYASV